MRRSALDIGSSACARPSRSARAAAFSASARSAARAACDSPPFDHDLPFAVAPGQRCSGCEVLDGVDRLPVAADQARRVAAAGDGHHTCAVLGDRDVQRGIDGRRDALDDVAHALADGAERNRCHLGARQRRAPAGARRPSGRGRPRSR